MKKMLVVLFCLLGVSFGNCASAADFYVDVNYDAAGCIINFNGYSGEQPLKMVNAVVVSGDQNPSGENTISIEAVRTGEKGVFSGKIYLDNNIESGLYTVYISSENGAADVPIIVYREESSAQYIATLNTTTTVAAFEQYLKENAEFFGVLESEYASCWTFVSEVAFSQKPQSGYQTVGELSQTLRTAKVAYEITTGEDVKELLKNNAALLGIDISEYELLSEEKQEVLNERLKQADYTAGKFSDIFLQEYIYTIVKKAEKWTDLKEAVIEHAQTIGISLDGTYKNISDKNAVFMEMFKKSINSFGDIAAQFNASAENCYRNENSTSGGNGGGGNGGGSVGSSINTGIISVQPPEDENITPQAGFSDIESHWAKTYITNLADMGVISGFEDGTFRPENNITRAEFIKIISQAFAIEENAGAEYVEYADVKESDWFYDAVSIAQKTGIMVGYDGMFMPNAYITREDAAAVLYRVLNMKQIIAEGTADYSDKEEISDYALKAVMDLSGIGIIHGDGTYFFPKNYMKRGEAATILILALQQGI